MHRFGEDVPPAKKHYDGVLRDMFGIFNRHLADNAYLAGDAYTIADISSYPDVHIHGKRGDRARGLPASRALARRHRRAPRGAARLGADLIRYFAAPGRNFSV